MTQIKAYILSVIAVALLCSLAGKIYPADGTSKQLIKTICGMLLLLTVVKPVMDMSFTDPSCWLNSYSEDAAAAVAEGEEQMILALKKGIKERAQAYILDKAAAYGVRIDVEISLSNDDMPIPIKAVMVGDVSPYVKAQLQNILQKELGIAVKEQIWK